MEEYQSNSNKSREEDRREKIEKVTNGTVTQRNGSATDKTFGGLIHATVNDICEYVIYEVLIPTIKRTAYDIICNSAGMVFGEKNASNKTANANRVSYREYYEKKDRPSYLRSDRNVNSYSYKDLIFTDRGDAESVLERMYEILERYDAVSIAELFELSGEPSSYTDNKYGWTDLRDARVRPVRGGYIIQLPRAITL